MNLSQVKSIPALQFAIFRIIFGAYLVSHVLLLIPYGTELYSNQGVLPDAAANPTFFLFPSIFWISDSPAIATGLLVLLLLPAAGFMLGWRRQLCAILLWYGWACLFNRNVLTSNPSLSYVGLLLMLTVLIPAAEPFSLRKARNSEWVFPAWVFWCAWWLMAIGYTFSGLVKLQSPSWVDGTALYHLADNPLSRNTHLRLLLLSWPLVVLKILTWSALAVEILFLPLSFTRKGRALAWLGMVGIHLGILLVIDFTDLTLGMLMLHLFTFDPDWLPAKKDAMRRIVFYDGECGFCQKSIQTFLDLDAHGILQFAPLQGKIARTHLPHKLRTESAISTMIYLELAPGEDARITSRSRAVFRIFDALGGLWRTLSLLRLLPLCITDSVYNLIAVNRHRWGAATACRLPTPEESRRFLT